MTNIVEKAQGYVFDLFKKELNASFLYHNYTHTERVLKSLHEIIAHSNVSEVDAEILQLAALFHDTGYTQTIDDHEKVSAQIAEDFLKENQVDTTTIKAVIACILATKFDFIPKTTNEKIICDADCSHFGKDYFPETTEFLRKELEIQGIVNFSASEWLDENIKMLSEQHQFHTDYALKNWQHQKEKNLSDLINTKNKFNKKLKKEKLKAKYKSEYKSESPDRAIQSFYRIALKNHIKLSDIADTKANILLSVNAIIISLLMSILFSKLDNPSNAYLIVPTVIFILFSVTTIILSIIATRPNVTRGKFTKEDIVEKRVNLSFFGNFHKMKLEEFEWAVSELLKDKNHVYNSLTKDLYFLGKVLNRKYRILRITYSIFMIGIIVSVLAFAISFKMQNFDFL